MMTDIFFHQQFMFIAIMCAFLFVPGWLFLHAFFHHTHFAPLERFALSVPISFAITTLTIILIDACGFALTQHTLLYAMGCVYGVLCSGSLLKKSESTHNHSHIYTFTKKQTLLITALIIFTIVLKGTFLINTIFPTATDLGHHMFWVEKIVKEHALPEYKKTEIITENDTVAFSQPEHIADFIVGEHIIFAAIKIFTHDTTVSTFPSLVLFVINIFTVLVLFILTRRLFGAYTHGDIVAIVLLLFCGPLWAISGAGAKFVSGGVIGNVIGNLLIPTIIYFIYRAFHSKNALFLIPALTTITALAYTHHLSTFIFGYIFFFSVVTFVICQRGGLKGYAKIITLLKNYYVLPLLAIIITALFFLHPPSYLNSDAISSSVGAPTKSTRTGIPFGQLMYMLGEARFVFGVIGLCILTGFLALMRCGTLDHAGKKQRPVTIYAGSFIVGWGVALLGMSMFPHLLKVNIISSRIATYGAFPLAILASFALVWLGATSLRNKDRQFLVPQSIVMTFLFCALVYTFTTGMRDNATSMKDAPKTNKALQTFHAGNYASKVFGAAADNGHFWLIKDHNYITADTWLKVFFANDYAYPLSRSYFNRYESHPNRERCTLYMISEPHSTRAKQCFDALSVTTILVNTEQDAAQFLTSDDFYRIYQNDTLSLFLRKK